MSYAILLRETGGPDKLRYEAVEVTDPVRTQLVPKPRRERHIENEGADGLAFYQRRALSGCNRTSSSSSAHTPARLMCAAISTEESSAILTSS
jgi:hypothetical protein